MRFIKRLLARLARRILRWTEPERQIAIQIEVGEGVIVHHLDVERPDGHHTTISNCLFSPSHMPTPPYLIERHIEAKKQARDRDN